MMAVRINVVRSRNKESADMKGWMIECTMGTVPVASRNNMIQHIVEWENTG